MLKNPFFGVGGFGFLLFVFLLVVMTNINNIFLVEAFLKFTIKNTPPGTATSPTNEPRDITLTYVLQFKSDEIVYSNSIVVSLSDDPTVAQYGLRIVTNSGLGTFNTGNQQLNFNFRIVIEHPSAKEAQILAALARVNVALGAHSDVERPKVLIATFMWSKLVIIQVDDTLRTYPDAKTNCAGQGGFLATFMKESEPALIRSAITSMSTPAIGDNWWVGLYILDPRGLYPFGVWPACFNEDPDYISSKCQNVSSSTSYYSYYAADCAGGTTCMTDGCARMTGFSCYTNGFVGTGIVNWDGLAVNNAQNFMFRPMWDGTNYNILDRAIPDVYTYKTICGQKQSYPGAAVAWGLSKIMNRTRSYTATKTKTISTEDTRSISASVQTSETFTKSISETDTVDRTATSSDSAQESATVTKSMSDETGTAHKSATSSDSADKSSSITKTLKTVTKITATKSSSGSFTEDSSQTSSASPDSSSSRSPSSSKPSPSKSDESLTAEATSSVSATFLPTQTNSSSRTSSNTSFPTFSTSLTAPTLTDPKSGTANETRTRELSETVTQTILRIVIPVKVVSVADSIGQASVALGMANPAVASSLARLSAAKGLAECGQGTDLNDAPSRFQSPFMWQIGNNDLRYQRGTIAGVGVLMVIIVTANYLLGGVLGKIFLKSWHEGALRMRFPSLIMLPFLIFHVPVATAASIMALYGNGNDVVAAFIGGTLLICIPITVAYEIGRRLTLGQCTLVKINMKTKEKKESRKKWSKRIGSRTYDFLNWALMYQYEWRDTLVLRYEEDLEKRIEQGDRVAKRELRQFNKEKNNENSRYPFFGHWGEFFDDVSLPYFFLIDFVVATIQGISAGAAAQKTTRTICFVSLTSALLACVAHTFVVVYKRPGISRLFQLYLLLSSIVTLVAFMLAYIKFIMKDQFNYDSAAEPIGLVQAVLGMAMSFVSLGQFFDFVHGLLDSLCFAKVEMSSSSGSDDDDEMKEKKKLEEDQDELAALLAKEEELKQQQQQQQEEEEEAQRIEEQEFENQAARMLLFGQKQNNSNNNHKTGEDGDDWSGMSARQRAFKLVRHFSSDDPALSSLKTSAQRDEDARRRKEEQDAVFVTRLKKQDPEIFASLVLEQEASQNLPIAKTTSDERQQRRNAIEDEAARMIEEDIAAFAAGTGTKGEQIQTLVSPKSGRAFSANFDSDFDDDDNDDGEKSNDKNINDNSVNKKFSSSGLFNHNKNSNSNTAKTNEASTLLGVSKSGIQVHSGFDSDFDDDDDEAMRRDIEALMNGQDITQKSSSNVAPEEKENTQVAELDDAGPSSPSMANPFLRTGSAQPSFDHVGFEDL